MVLYVTGTAFQVAPQHTQLMLRSAGLWVRYEQSAPCYNHSLPACNAAYPAHVALWRAVLALQHDSSTLLLEAP